MIQSCARKQGYEVSILYANFFLAAYIGLDNYIALSNIRGMDLIGERFFASSAYGLPRFGSDGFIDSDKSEVFADICHESHPNFKISEMKRLERKAAVWADDVAKLVAAHEFKVVGSATTFEQTASSIALLKRIKQLRPDMITILGGANCEGIMAKGILSLSDSADYVFSGDCEGVFPEFLAQVREGRLPSERIVRGSPCMEMEDLPLPNYDEFYSQYRLILPGYPEDKYRVISYQSSKGCWWGEGHQCAFCGLNGENIGYRHKSAERVLSDLKALSQRYPDRLIAMTDNIMPSEYFETLIPRIAKELPDVHLLYEVRSSLSMKEVAALKHANFDSVQAGIESLSTPCLRRIRKGITARQNLAFLRYARSVGLSVAWNMMHDIPGEQPEDIEQLLNLIPLLHHLQPPNFGKLRIDRFSPFFRNPMEYGLSNVRPWDSYFATLPADADVQNVAYHFQADYQSASRDHPARIECLKREIDVWRSLWRSEGLPPSLEVVSAGNGKFMVVDTRGLPGAKRVSFISRDEARVALCSVGLKQGDELLGWALAKRLVAEVDSIFVPLATGSPDLISKFEEEVGTVAPN